MTDTPELLAPPAPRTWRMKQPNKDTLRAEIRRLTEENIQLRTELAKATARRGKRDHDWFQRVLAAVWKRHKEAAGGN